MKNVVCVGYGKLGKIIVNVLTKSGLHVDIVDVQSDPAATVVPSVGEVSGFDAVILTLPSFAEVEKVLTECPKDKLRGKIILNLSSVTIEQSEKLCTLTDNIGANLVIGAVICHRDAVGTDDSYISYSGDEQAYKTLSPVIDALKGARYMGENIMAASLMDYTANGIHYSYVLAFYTGVAMCRKYGFPMDTYLYHTLKSLPPLAEAAKRNIFTGLDDPRTFEEVDDVIHGMEMLVCLLKKTNATQEVRYNDERLKKMNGALYKHWNDIMEVYSSQK